MWRESEEGASCVVKLSLLKLEGRLEIKLADEAEIALNSRVEAGQASFFTVEPRARAHDLLSSHPTAQNLEKSDEIRPSNFPFLRFDDVANEGLVDVGDYFSLRAATR